MRSHAICAFPNLGRKKDGGGGGGSHANNRSKQKIESPTGQHKKKDATKLFGRPSWAVLME